MALPALQLVVLKVPDGSGGPPDSILIDVCKTETHALENKLTDHPVEQGYNVTDHSRPDPPTVSIECVQSNTPLSGARVGDYAGDLWAIFKDLHDKPRLVELYTTREHYTDMGVESVTVTVDAKSAQTLSFTAKLKKVRIVANKFTTIKVAKDTRAQPTVKRGVTTNTSAAAGGVAWIANALGLGG